MTAPKLALIEWEDARCLDAEQWCTERDHSYRPLIVKSVGFVLSESKEGYVITAALSSECIGPRDQIPRGMVRKITYLKG